MTLWDSKQRGLAESVLLHPVILICYWKGGRPDVMKLIKEVYISWGAEVVFITSNFGGNKEMMEGCKEAGIPAFVRYLPSKLADPILNIFLHRERCGTSNLSPYSLFIIAYLTAK